MSKSTASIGPWDNRYGVRFDVEDGTVTTRLTRSLLDGSTAFLQYPPQTIVARNFIDAFRTRIKLNNAVEAARYWKREWEIERNARELPLAVGIMGVGAFMAKYLLGRK